MCVSVCVPLENLWDKTGSLSEFLNLLERELEVMTAVASGGGTRARGLTFNIVSIKTTQNTRRLYHMRTRLSCRDEVYVEWVGGLGNTEHSSLHEMTLVSPLPDAPRTSRKNDYFPYTLHT